MGTDQWDAEDVTIPDSFLAMPRWWTEGRQWLSDLPRLIRSRCRQWNLRVTGAIVHGANSVVVPVVQADRDLVLRLSFLSTEVEQYAAALRFWAGRGTVELVEADPPAGAMLLERLGSESLQDRPVDEAMCVLGQVMRRLAIPAPLDAPSTADVVRVRAAELEAEWRQLDRPFDRAFLTAALDAADTLTHSDSNLAVNGDLHSEQVLRGDREPWLVVDPLLLRGDIEYDLARVLWTRLDELPDTAAIIEQFDIVVHEATIDRHRARDWVLYRTVDYWLWCLRTGLTEDPLRCHRLASTVTA